MLTITEVRHEIAEALAKAGLGQAPQAELVPLFVEDRNGRFICVRVPKSGLKQSVLNTPQFREGRAA